MAKKSKEKFKVYKNVFDEFTRRTLFELESKGHFLEESLIPISVGKESNVFWGQSQDKEVWLGYVEDTELGKLLLNSSFVE